MTEEEARQWFARGYGQQATDQVAAFLRLVVAENERHNLIAPSTIGTIWVRHALDSAQLVEWGAAEGRWLDVGTGGGFPGVVVAILRAAPITLVEPRARRAAFLAGAIEALELNWATVVDSKVERLTTCASVISARAVASVEKLLQATAQCATQKTRWILPRGKFSSEELADLRRRQRDKVFHVEQSLTDPASTVLIVENRR